jgi:hypothetical protein
LIVKLVVPHASLITQTAHVFAVFALPDYLLAALTIDRIGRRVMQTGSFVFIGLAFFGLCSSQAPRQRETEREGGCQFGSLAGELAESDPETRADLAAGFERWEALFQEGLRAKQDRGQLRADTDPEQLAWAFPSAMQGEMLMIQTKRDIGPLQASLGASLAYLESFACEQ